MAETAGEPSARLIDVTLDTRSILRWNADIEHERRVAIFDLLEENVFAPEIQLPGNHPGPFKLHLRIEEERLVFELYDPEGTYLNAFRLALTPFRRLIKAYFEVCDSYYKAVREATPQRIESLDMGRRSLHDEGSALLRERLAGKVEMDDITARRLFTLICVLHIRA